MDVIIEFFRDTLDGPFYIVWVVVLVILIFACIGYLAEKGINDKKEKEKYATVDDSSINNTVTGVQPDMTLGSSSSIEEPPLETILGSSNEMTDMGNTVSEDNKEEINAVQEVTTAGLEPLGVNNMVSPNVEIVSSDTVGTIPTIVSEGTENSEQAFTSVQEVAIPISNDVTTNNALNEQITPVIQDVAEPLSNTTVTSDNTSSTNFTNSNIDKPVPLSKSNLENNEQPLYGVQEITTPINNENVVIPVINQDESTTI